MVSCDPAPPASLHGPKVRLVNAFDVPFNNAIATARTCYSSRIITPAEVDKDERTTSLRDRIASSTYEAGHHTVYQHATFQFALEDVSRQLLWSFLHAHPFYNSEQVSQRYVAVKRERVFIPRQLTGQARQRYCDTVALCTEAYHTLTAQLEQPAAAAYFAVFPARRKQPERYQSEIKKKAQEVARYALPVATFAHLYHTISGLTLHRYHRLSHMLDVPEEVSQLVSAMVAQVKAHDPLFFRDIEDPLPLEHTHEYQVLSRLHAEGVASDAAAFIRRFDQQLDGRLARLVDYSARGEATLAESVRTVLALDATQLDDDAAIGLVLDPQHNPLLRESLNLKSLGKLTRALAHPHYTFAKKLSHAADSQEQRHRTTPGARPLLATHYAGGSPDVVVPELMEHSEAARETFDRTMAQVWRNIDGLLADGVPVNDALYLLPNAYPIRYMASGDLQSQHHKWTARLCYNAQEEIWRASLDEVRAVSQVHPRIGRWLMPPCGLRHRGGGRPICPEGSRYCGVPVWKLERADYKRVL